MKAPSIVCALFVLTVVISIEGRGIVRRSGTKFIDADCKEVMYSGWNSWQLMEAAAGITNTSLYSILDTMRDSGLTVGRFFGHGTSHETLVLQTSPGQYNSRSLVGLDKVLAAVANRGLRVVLTLTDNWTEADSKKQYAKWAGKDPDEFYTHPKIKKWFKAHIQFLATRVNTINGRIYRDDPVIFSWNLMNEPRCECYTWGCYPSCRDRMQTWIDEMATYLKSVDPNHMVTVGEEGFFSYESGLHGTNPDIQKGHDWAVESGQDFYANHASPAIDYGAVHCWPDNWGGLSIEFQNRWIYEHIAVCKSLGKPMTLEEFGKATKSFHKEEIKGTKDPFFQQAFDIFNADKTTGVFKGIGFWDFGHSLPYGVKTDHSTWNEIIVPQSRSLQDHISGNEPIAQCQPGHKRSLDIVTYNNISYTTAGPNLIFTNSKEFIDVVSSFEECIAECSKTQNCKSAQYNASFKKCKLLSSQNVDRLIWSSVGWQQYNKQL